jgi:hypothetical protein
MFSQRAIQEFKEAFGIMDADKVWPLTQYPPWRIWSLIELDQILNFFLNFLAKSFEW